MNEFVESADSQVASPGETFEITLGRRGGFGSRSPMPYSLGMKGKGTLTIGDTQVAIRGSKSAGMFRSATDEVAFSPADVLDVEQAGNIVKFRVPAPSGNRLVQFEAGNDLAAARIVALLPTRVSAEHATKMAELSEFHERLLRLTSVPRVAPVLVGLNVLMFVVMAIGGAGIFAPDGDVIIGWGSNFGPLTMGAGQWWRLFTATFIHFGILHLALNMWALYLTGLTTERLYGSARFALLYVFAGLTGSVASLLWNPMVNSAGASGAIFGVYGGLLAFAILPKNGVPPAVMTEQRNSTLVFAAYNLMYGASHAGIDNAAHVGGLLGGFLIGLALARPLDDRRLARGGNGKLLATIGGACLVLGLAVTPLLKPNAKVAAQLDYQSAITGFDDDQANAAMNEAFAQAKKNTAGSDIAAATALRDKVVPKWMALEKRFSKSTLPADDPDFHRQALIRRYLTGRRTYCELLSRAVLEHNDVLTGQAQQAFADADSAVEELNRLNGQK